MCMSKPDEAPQARKLQLESGWPARFQLVVYGAFGLRVLPLAAQFPSKPRLVFTSPDADLAELWLHAPPGRLSAKEQLQAMALREATQGFGEGTVNFEWIASKLTVGGSPSRRAVRKLFHRDDNARFSAANT